MCQISRFHKVELWTPSWHCGAFRGFFSVLECRIKDMDWTNAQASEANPFCLRWNHVAHDFSAHCLPSRLGDPLILPPSPETDPYFETGESSGLGEQGLPNCHSAEGAERQRVLVLWQAPLPTIIPQSHVLVPSYSWQCAGNRPVGILRFWPKSARRQAIYLVLSPNVTASF
jgi:hypothetical protein